MKSFLVKITELIEQGKKLYDSNDLTDDPDFQAWRCDVLRFLTRIYDKGSVEVTSFDKIRFYHPPMFLPPPPENRGKIKEDFRYGLTVAISLLERYKQDEADDTEEHEQKAESGGVPNNKIFIVHGRNNDIKAQVATFLSKLKIDPIILHEQPNKGQTIIEKFEENSNVQAAIVLFTRDDEGKLKGDSEFEDRARQNVVFEAGFFMGKLGRERTIALLEGGLKKPSDLDGLVYIDIDSNGGWQIKVAGELKNLNFDIDMNSILN